MRCWWRSGAPTTNTGSRSADAATMSSSASSTASSKRILQQDVLDGIARQRQLGENRQTDALVVTLPRHLQHRFGIGRGLTDRGVHGARGDPEKALAIGGIEVHHPPLSLVKCHKRVTGYQRLLPRSCVVPQFARRHRARFSDFPSVTHGESIPVGPWRNREQACRSTSVAPIAARALAACHRPARVRRSSPVLRESPVAARRRSQGRRLRGTRRAAGRRPDRGHRGHRAGRPVDDQGPAHADLRVERAGGVLLRVVQPNRAAARGCRRGRHRATYDRGILTVSVPLSTPSRQKSMSRCTRSLPSTRRRGRHRRRRRLR